MNWYLMVWQKFAQFDGRARRKEYWMFTLFNMIVFVALYVPGLVYKESGLGLIFLGLYGLYALAAFVPSLSVSVRRLHDTGRSGWYFLLGFIPLVGLVLLVFMCEDGTRGENEYGPNPKASEFPAYSI